MKIRQLLLSITLVGTLQMLAQETQFNTNQAIETNKPSNTIRTVEHLTDGILATYRFDEALFVEDDVFSGCYQVVIPEFNMIQASGLPAITVGTDRFLFQRKRIL
ncbi:MAG: hypothetical protein K2O88_03285 [Paramuribaculum sp.]|nr:hypothetical protein [Paramuribaculum sp.]